MLKIWSWILDTSAVLSCVVARILLSDLIQDLWPNSWLILLGMSPEKCRVHWQADTQAFVIDSTDCVAVL